MAQAVHFVCFTGQAHDAAGNAILRSDLGLATQKAGMKIVTDMKYAHPSTILVASRTDTVKAKNAKLNGVDVWTYPQFLELLAGTVPLAIESKNKPHKWEDPDAEEMTRAQKIVQNRAPFLGVGNVL